MSLPSTGCLEGSVQSLDQSGCDLGHVPGSGVLAPPARSGCLREGQSSSGEPCSEAHVATGPSLSGTYLTQDSHSGGLQLGAPRADAQARVNRWGQPSVLGAGGEREGMGHQSEPRGRKAKLRGRGARRRAESTETRALAGAGGPSGWGNVVSRPINLPGRKTGPDQQKGCPWHQAETSSPFSAKDTR